MLAGSNANLLRLLLFLAFACSCAAVLVEDALGHPSDWAKAAVASSLGLLVGQHLPSPTDQPAAVAPIVVRVPAGALDGIASAPAPPPEAAAP